MVTLGTKFAWGAGNDKSSASTMPHKKMQQLMLELEQQPLLSRSNAQKIVIPVRYMVGDKDKMVTIEETAAMFRATKNAELAVLPNTRHALRTVDVKRMSQEITQYLVFQS